MKALAIFCAEGLSFLAAAINIRACAKGRLAVTLGTDALIAGMNFMLVV